MTAEQDLLPVITSPPGTGERTLVSRSVMMADPVFEISDMFIDPNPPFLDPVIFAPPGGAASLSFVGNWPTPECSEVRLNDAKVVQAKVGLSDILGGTVSAKIVASALAVSIVLSIEISLSAGIVGAP